MSISAISVYKEYILNELILNYEVGQKWGKEKDTIESIEYNEPRGEEDAHYCDVKFSSGRTERIFKPDEVVFYE